MSLFVVVPVAQQTDVVEALVDAGVEEQAISVVAVDPSQGVAVMQIDADNSGLTPSQIASVISRSLSVEVKEIQLSASTNEIEVETAFTDVMQSVSVVEHGFDIAVVAVTGDIDADEVIDKRDD